MAAIEETSYSATVFAETINARRPGTVTSHFSHDNIPDGKLFSGIFCSLFFESAIDGTLQCRNSGRFAYPLYFWKRNGSNKSVHLIIYSNMNNSLWLDVDRRIPALDEDRGSNRYLLAESWSSKTFFNGALDVVSCVIECFSVSSKINNMKISWASRIESSFVYYKNGAYCAHLLLDVNFCCDVMTSVALVCRVTVNTFAADFLAPCCLTWVAILMKMIENEFVAPKKELETKTVQYFMQMMYAYRCSFSLASLIWSNTHVLVGTASTALQSNFSVFSLNLFFWNALESRNSFV